MKTIYRCCCLMFASWLIFISTAQAEGIIVTDPWVRGVPPSAKSSAAFMTIENTGSAEMMLVSASSELAEIVEIHTMEQVGEMMKMKEIQNLSIPANGSTALAPKGYHIMLIGLLRPLSEGETVSISLNFANGTIVTVDAVVRKWGPTPMHHH